MIVIGILGILILSYSIIPTFYYKFKGTPIVNNIDEKKFLSLTFDDGPDKKYTGELLDLLKKYNIKATFFVVAKFAEENYELIKRMEEEGHTIGLHSLEHKNALLNGPLYTNKEFEESLKIMDKINVNIKSFRPPWGHLNLLTIRNLKKFNLNLVLWDVIIGDWKADITSDEISRRLLSQSKNKSIICLHDGRGKNEAPKRTIEALEKTIPVWIEEGYKFLKVGELYE
ncbi:polysaccharide deacetylase family protein [Clostridium sp.]|jgi:peptidoglycan/xylan/chitin deacetylase (PgdA/CDA1 family)|uniref:polysaccharide deacetylase family protein n=2 Tax=Clostridium TaxID=1485 RepID=UPI0025B8EF94|nr:polysaccharide deacetylase family protein [Clostridium sp.]MCI9069304.1 polysaccharide deacetylase family protein [Clostridium sp.]MCI9302792.1 polysaccharide deacetylase family protein [Clostridium sp.]